MSAINWSTKPGMVRKFLKSTPKLAITLTA
jgi:hypothetical protein